MNFNAFKVLTLEKCVQLLKRLDNRVRYIEGGLDSTNLPILYERHRNYY